MTKREELVSNLERAQKELDEYDEFFAKLEKGMTLYEELIFDDVPVTLISWERETGWVTVEYDIKEEKFIDTALWWNYNFEPRKEHTP